MIVALIGGAGPAAAQVLVTNLSEPNDGGYWLGTFDFAQPFTTGTNASGYQLESISIDFLTGRSREYEPVYVYVYGDNGRGGPNHRDQIARPTINGATFEGPVTGVNKYTVRKYGRPAPFNASSVHLDANTQYWVFVWAGEDKTLVNVDDTRSNEETGEPGWSIGDSGLLKPEGSAYSNYIESPTAMKIQVEGYANPEVLISISDATATEGPGVTADFVVTLNRSWSRTITVEYITLFTLSATPGVDYQDRNGTLTFQPGETSKIISVPIIDDTVPDSGETFELLLYDAKGADIADETGIGTILNTEILTGSFDNVPGEHDGLTGSFEGRARGARRAERLQLPGCFQRGHRDQLQDAARRVLHDDGRRGNRRTARRRAQRPVGDHGEAIGRGKCDDHAPPPRLWHDRGRLHPRGHAEGADQQPVGDGGGAAVRAVDGELQRRAGVS